MGFLRRQPTPPSVTVYVPGVVTFDAAVVASVSGASEIALPRQLEVETRFLHRRRALVIGVDGQGHKQAGTLLAYEADDGTLRGDRIQLLHDGATTVPERAPTTPLPRGAIPLSRLDEDLAEEIAAAGTDAYLLDDRPGSKRRSVRVDLVRPAAVIPDGLRRSWLNGTVRNVSATGLMLTAVDRLTTGDRLRVRFELAHEDDVIDATGRVVRHSDAGGDRGVAIDRIGERERERLIRFIYETQRRALARRSG